MHRTTSVIDADGPHDALVGKAPGDRDGRTEKGGFAIRRILVVCVGNVCRSPIVEFLLRKGLAGRDVVVESAGIGAVEGARIDPAALAVLEHHGMDADGHVARRLNKSMIDAADLVLVMERQHLEFIRSWIPSAAGKTFLLGKWQGDFEVPDPFGKSRETFERLYRMVDLAVKRWSELI